MTLSYDKILLRAALCMLTLLLTGACSRRGPVLTFREADDPTADTLADWSGVASGLHAAWGTTDKRYARSVVPCAAESECRLTAWRGELASDNTPEGAAKRAELEAAVRPFEAHDPARPWPDLLRRAKETLARLSE